MICAALHLGTYPPKWSTLETATTLSEFFKVNSLKFLYCITHFPMSRNPSITFIFLGPENDVVFVYLKSGLPGCMSRPNASPKQTLKTDVRTKYTIVRTATFPFLLISKLAAPENNFNSY